MADLKSLVLRTGNREDVLCEYDMDAHDLWNKVKWRGVNTDDTKVAYYFPQAIILDDVSPDLSPIYHEIRSAMVRMFNMEDKTEICKKLKYIVSILETTVLADFAREDIAEYLSPENMAIEHGDTKEKLEGKWASEFVTGDAELVYKDNEEEICSEAVPTLTVIFRKGK